MAPTLPYRVEMSRGAQNCTRCKRTIQSETIQLGRMEQSKTEDALAPVWYDLDCFFKQFQPASENLIDNFTKLCNKDQTLIRKRMRGSTSNTKGKQAKKRPATDTSQSFTPLPASDFSVSVATSENRNTCSCCFCPIPYKQVQILKVVEGIEENGMSTALWYHMDCFVKHSSTLGWYHDVEQFPGFKRLDEKHKQNMIKKFGLTDQNNNEPDVKKMKLGSLDDVNSIIEDKMKIQNRHFYNLRTNLEKSLTTAELTEILQANEQFIPTSPSDILDHATDVIYFGALNPCNKCKNGKFILSNSVYACKGDLSDFAKCNNMVKEPARSKVTIPKNLQDKKVILKANFKTKVRATKFIPSKVNASEPLRDLEFAIVVSSPLNKEIKNKVEKMGGTVVGLFVTSKTAAVISDVEEVTCSENKMKLHIKQAKIMGIQVVSADKFFEAVKNDDPFNVIKQMNIAKWPCKDPCNRIPRNDVLVQKSDSFYADPQFGAQKWKNGIAVDVDCNLENAHVLKLDTDSEHCGCPECCSDDGDEPVEFYVASMALVDIASNKNSYCRLQLIESDDEERYWLFEKQGRISTNIGSTDLKELKSFGDAIDEFHQRFEFLTGNEFGDDNFQKQPEKFQVLDIVYDNTKEALNNLVKTELDPSVYEVMKIICDENAMKHTLLELHLDTDHMPMGRISNAQIKTAAEILKELSELVKKKGSTDQFIEASNRFYTMIPHKFGLQRPPIINTDDMIKRKTEMINQLQEIEYTYSLLNDIDGKKNPLDTLYDKLKAVITPLDPCSIEYDEINTYIEQTHAQDYFHFDIELQNIFEVVRDGEEDRFEPFKNLHNRTLLWHGSNPTNFVGILSNGLKTTPPEVYISGKAFGNGIYFADAIGKSARYCYRRAGDTALLLLCEVALGDIVKFTQFGDCEGLEEAPRGAHSVKGVGKSYARSEIVRTDGIKIPFGNIELDKNMKSQLDLNEYVVYKDAQVKLRYLVQVKFKNYSEDDSSDCD